MLLCFFHTRCLLTPNTRNQVFTKKYVVRDLAPWIACVNGHDDRISVHDLVYRWKLRALQRGRATEHVTLGCSCLSPNWSGVVSVYGCLWSVEFVPKQWVNRLPGRDWQTDKSDLLELLPNVKNLKKLTDSSPKLWHILWRQSHQKESGLQTSCCCKYSVVSICSR